MHRVNQLLTPTRTRIKLCGLRDIASAMAAVKAGADAIGLVFATGSAREISEEAAAEIVQALPAFVEPVGICVNLPAQRVRQLAEATGLHTVQLHGREDPDYAASLAPLRVIKAIAFRDQEASSLLEPWRNGPPNVTAMLYDAPPPAEAEHETVTGGYGDCFDWNMLSTFAENGGLNGLPPAILAGGLTPDNVAEAINTVAPYAVDVSSGIESSRGTKDVKLMQSFCRAVVEADAAQA